MRDGVLLLQELGAFDADGAITDVGRRLAQLPVDPRIGRMILQADAEGCVREVLVLAAALSIPDPRERPADHEEAARQKHARFADEHSDFVSFLNLWSYLREQRQERSGNQFRRMCREEFLHYLRVREWQDLAGQLRSIARDLGITERTSRRRPERDARRADRRAAQPRRRCARATARDYARCAQLALRPRARLGAHEAAAALDRGRRPGRDQPAVRTDRGADRTRSRSSGSPGTSSSAPTASRTGTRAAARRWPTNG